MTASARAALFTPEGRAALSALLMAGRGYDEIAAAFSLTRGSLASAISNLRQEYPADFPALIAKPAAARESGRARRADAKLPGCGRFEDISPDGLAAETRALRRQWARVRLSRRRQAFAALVGGPGGC